MKYVYLIHCEDDGTFKLGSSKHPEKRVKEVQTGNANEVKLYAKFFTDKFSLLETTLHRKYASQRKKGEWFELSISDADNFLNTCESTVKMFDFIEKNSTYGLK